MGRVSQRRRPPSSGHDCRAQSATRQTQELGAQFQAADDTVFPQQACDVAPDGPVGDAKLNADSLIAAAMSQDLLQHFPFPKRQVRAWRWCRWRVAALRATPHIRHFLTVARQRPSLVARPVSVLVNGPFRLPLFADSCCLLLPDFIAWGCGHKESFQPSQRTGFQAAQASSMRGLKSKSPPQRTIKRTSSIDPDEWPGAGEVHCPIRFPVV